MKKKLQHFICILATMLICIQSFGAVTDSTPTPKASLTNGVLTFYYTSNSIAGGYTYNIETKYTSSNPPAWYKQRIEIKKVVFDPSFANYFPTSTAYWFYGCEELKEIEDLEYLNTGNVTIMNSMFSYCSSLTELDVSGFDTKNVTDLAGMFSYCSSLTELDVSCFDTKNVTYMYNMFYNCSSLTELDVSGFDTKNVTYMYNMFYNCSSLTELDVSGFDTKNVTDMHYMFYQCKSLKTIYASENWNTGNITVSGKMFYDCLNLVGGKGTTYNSGKTGIQYAHVDGGTSNPGYFTDKKIEEEVPEDIDDTIPSDGDNGQTSGAYTVLHNGTLTFYYDNNRSSKTGTVYDIYTSYTGYPDWAKDSLSITKAVFDVSFINFKPTSTAYWFSCCPIMTEIEGLGRLDTRNVTDMQYMFHNCRSLTKLDTGDFLTSQVTDMSNMFSGCHELSSVDVTCFNTSNVITMEAMFMDCRSLTEIDVTGFETKNVSTMAHMFRGCNSLTEVNLKNMSIANLRITYAMFYDCDALTTIYSNTDWSAGSITSSDFMFGHCMQLKGGNGTLFDARNTNKSYALPDSGNSRPGYFTMRNGGGTPGGNVGTNGAPVYAVLNNGTLTFYCDNLWSSRAGTRYDIDDLNYSYSDQLRSYRSMPEWIEDRNLIKRAVFDSSFANYRPKSTVCWFYSCQNLTSIEGMEYLNTSEVTNMSAMFRFCYALTDVDVSHMDTRNVTDMSFVFCYCESLTHIDVSMFNTEKVTNMEHMFHTCPVDILDLRNFETSKVTNMNTMFDLCGSLKTIYAKRDKWNTDNVTNSSWMFTGCESLVGGQGTKYDSNHTDKEYAVIDEGMCTPGYLTGDAADLPREAYAVYKDSTLTFYYDCNINCRKAIEGAVVYTEEQFAKKRTNHHPDWYSQYSNYISIVVFDPSFADYEGVETVNYWFYDLYYLKFIRGIEYLNTSNVTDMNHMFNGCSSLMSLDVSGFKTDKVTDMRGMFRYCSSLTSLNVSGFKTDNVTNMHGMFERCSNLTSLNLNGLKTDNVTNMGEMFYDCFRLTSLDLSGFNTNNVTSMGSMFYGCSSLTSLDISGFRTDNVTDMVWMFRDCSGLTSLDVSGFKTDNVRSMFAMFYNCRCLTSLDLSGFKTDNVTGMSEMFSGCSSLTSLDVSGFRTDNVTKMDWMFNDCSNLTSLDVSGFNTYNVKDMGWMFNGCSKLTSLDVSGFKTDKVTNMGSMFFGCSNLTSLDVSGFKTDNVTDMGGMFSGCFKLTSLDVSGFNTDNVTSMSSMFSGCSGLTSLDVSGFKTDNVTYMSGMFSGCSGLTSLDVSSFNTYNVTDMRWMFKCCAGLTTLDLSCFDTSNVTNMFEMFIVCSNLTTIYCGDNWTTNKVESSRNMFSECINLVGGKGTAYDVSHLDAAYAHVDDGANNPGYLTLKNSSQGDDEPSTIEVTDISQIDNVIYMGETEVRAGTQATISLKMKNTTDIRGFQFDLYLPEGVTAVKSAKGKIQGALSEGRLPDEDEHTLTLSEQPDGAIRFLCSSQFEETFTGTDGEVATLQVNVADNMEDGDYAIQLKDVKLTENDISKFYLTDLVTQKLTVMTYISGDISGDGIVDVSDYTGIANYIHGNTPTGFNAKAADVNTDNAIDVLDYTGIANIIHTGSVHGTNHAMMVLSSNNSPLEVTDVSNINNVIYITPFSAAAGSEEYSVSINMKNVAAIRGFQFDLYLPEGVTAAKSAKGRIQGALSAGRLPEEDGHELTLSEQPDGAIRFLCSSQYEETFTGNDGEIATLKVNVDPDMPTGEYAVVLKDVKLTENDISIFYLTDQVNTTMTVTEATDGRILLDELSTSVPTAATNVNVRVKRTINANEWSTICLPFDMTEEQVKTVFGDDVQLKEFMEYEVSDGGKQISVTFDNALLAQDGFMANHPYIIKVSSKIEEFTVDGVTIDPDEDNAVAEYDNGKTGSRRQVYGTFKGTYHAGTTVPNNCLFLSDNKFWYSKGNTNMKAFRGYFDFKDVLEDADGARIGMSFNDETTGIGYNKRETITNNQWYTLDGRKLGKKPAEKGLYIVNNKKVVVR